MTSHKKLRVAAFTMICMLPLNAVAETQDNSGTSSSDATASASQAPIPLNLSTSIGEVTIGAGWVSQSSAVFGRYNGMPDAGFGTIGGWNLQNRDAWDSGETHYFDTTGDNINFGFGEIAPEASASLKVGDQGQWWLSAAYDAMTYTATDHFTSILDKNGNLAPGYQAALVANGLYFDNVTTAPPASAHFGAFNAKTHLATSNPVTFYGPGNQLVNDVGTRRDKGAIGAGYELGNWLITTGISHEHKEGTLEQSMTTGGNNAGMVTFPMPINYDTDTYTVSAAYNSDDLQANLSYKFSNFTDNNSDGYAFQGWNFAAFENTAVMPNTYTSFAKSGVYSLPPSNQAHTLSGEIGYNFDETTRVYGTVVYGLQLQDDPFSAATDLGYVLTNPTLSAELASNPNSLNGLVQTFFGNVTLTSRPLPKLDIKASYTIDARDPQTQSMFVYGDPTDTTALKFREAVPESWVKQKFALTAGYHFLQETQLTLGYTFEDAQRDFAITHRAQDNEETIKVQSSLATNVTGSLGYVHAERTTSAPDFSLWLVQIQSDCGSTLATLGCQQIPFYEAARTQDAVTGMMMGMINDKTSLSLFGKFDNDRYNLPAAIYNGTVNPSVGINRDYNIQAGPDLNYQVDTDTDVHVFYTFLRTYRAMRALNDQVSTTSGGNFYSEASTYDIQTAGIGGTWRANDKLKFGADYIYSYGAQRFAQSGSWDTTEAGQTFGGDPSLGTKSSNHQIRIHATYDYTSNISLYLGYEFNSLDMNDWALVGASVGQVLTGDVPPKYNVSTVMAAVTMKL